MLLLAPIVLFVYNRPNHTRQTLEALASNDLASESILYIYADGPKENASNEDLNKILENRRVIRAKKWCKEVYIIESETNKGLASSVINGVTEVLNKHGKVIVLEDDIVVSKFFLKYMNDSLELYKSEEKVFQISAFNFPIKKFLHSTDSFFIPYVSTWGWATWSRSWKKFDPMATGYEEIKTNDRLCHKFNLDSSFPYSEMLLSQMEKKNIDSWGIRWLWSVFKNEGLVLFPSRSLISNIGYDSEGTHTKKKSDYEENILTDYKISYYPKKIACDKTRWNIIKKYLAQIHSPKDKFNFSKKIKFIYYNYFSRSKK